MPNWVYNTLIVNGAPEEVKKFITKVIDERDDFDFARIIPEPKTERECPKRFRCKSAADAHITEAPGKPWFNWYEWNIANWGTKWNACETEVDYTEGEGICRITFNTAWSAPIPVMNEMFDQFRKLRFEYEWIEEQGCVDLGRIVSENNVIVEENVPAEGSKEAYELMFEMWGGRESYVFDKEKNTYVEIEYEYSRYYEEHPKQKQLEPEEWYEKYGRKILKRREED